jgi:hypothetical protein
MTMKRMQSTLAIALTLFTAGALGARAQAPGSSAPMQPAGAAVDPAKSLDATVTRLENLWMGAAQAMPADKYNFAPSAAIFVSGQKVQYDGVRTFAEIVTHTIQANYGAFAAIGGIKPDVDVKALAATFAFAHKAVANVTTANAFLAVRGTQTPVTLFAGAIGHAEDEYGQAVEYLRMNAIVPPASETRPRM